MMKFKGKLWNGTVILAGMCLPAIGLAVDSSGEYKQVKSLGGTSQSICRPAIDSDEDRKTFARNQRGDILAILKDSGWQGDPEAVFDAIRAGDFMEKSYPVGTRLVWMGMRNQGAPIAAKKRQWAGRAPFKGFELNIESNCSHHRLVIPKACCNLSLVQSQPKEIAAPAISVGREGQISTIRVNSVGKNSTIDLTYPDGRTEGLQLVDGQRGGADSPELGLLARSGRHPCYGRRDSRRLPYWALCLHQRRTLRGARWQAHRLGKGRPRRLRSRVQ